MPGKIKINANVSLSEEGWVGLGALGRDHVRRILFSVVRRVQATRPPDVAECKAIFMAACRARRHGRKEVVIESGSQALVNRLWTTTIYFLDLDAILGDIIDLCSRFDVISFSRVKRDGNSVAHNLAKIMPFDRKQ